MRKLLRSKGNYIISIFFISTSLFFSCKENKTKIKVAEEISIVPGNENASMAQAHQSSEDLLKTDSLNAGLRKDLAFSYYANKDYDKAVYHLLILHRLDKKNTDVLVTLGNIYYDTQQDKKAIEFYEKALRLEKWNYNVRCDMATCYRRIKQPDIATRLLKENITMNFSHAQSHYNLSVILKENGNLTAADEEMAIYQKLNSGNN
jgi:tetratricopeptide (TPR) repeat protein